MLRHRNFPKYSLPGCVAAFTLTWAVAASAAPPGACEPWPECKDDGAGEPPGLSTCNDVFIDDDPASANRTCWALDDPGTDCVVSRAQDNTPGWFFTQSCQTSTTLVVPYSDPIVGGQGHTLKLLGPWLGGRAAIVNEGAIARVADLTIFVDDPDVADGSCGTAGKVDTAVSLDPHIAGSASGVPRMAIANSVVAVGGGAQFCNGLEYASTSDDTPVEVPMFAGGIGNNTIADGSYSRSGVVARFINTTDNVTGDSDNVSVSNNTINSSDGCTGIEVHAVERVAINDNTVYAPSCDDNGAVGIDIVNAGVNDASLGFSEARPIAINKNIVILDSMGADVGISIVDSRVEKNQGNTLTGNGAAYACSNSGTVPFPTNGKKKNTFNGTTVESSAGC